MSIEELLRQIKQLLLEIRTNLNTIIKYPDINIESSPQLTAIESAMAGLQSYQSQQYLNLRVRGIDLGHLIKAFGKLFKVFKESWSQYKRGKDLQILKQQRIQAIGEFNTQLRNLEAAFVRI